jgi:hypothetical protein
MYKNIFFSIIFFLGFFWIEFPEYIILTGCTGNNKSILFERSLYLLNKINMNYSCTNLFLGDIDYYPQKKRLITKIGIFNRNFGNYNYSILGNHDIDSSFSRYIAENNRIHFISDTILNFSYFNFICVNSNKDYINEALFLRNRKPYFLVLHHPPVKSNFHKIVRFWEVNFDFFNNDKNLIAIISAHEHCMAFFKERKLNVIISGSFSDSRPKNKILNSHIEFISNEPGFLIIKKNRKCLNVGSYNICGFRSFFTLQLK